MIKGKSKQWHYDCCVQMWCEIYENPKLAKKDTLAVQKYEPMYGCFACELFREDTLGNEGCEKCHFLKYKTKLSYFNHESNNPCCSEASPYSKWDDLRYEYEYFNGGHNKYQKEVHEKLKEYALEIAQLFCDYGPCKETRKQFPIYKDSKTGKFISKQKWEEQQKQNTPKIKVTYIV